MIPFCPSDNTLASFIMEEVEKRNSTGVSGVGPVRITPELLITETSGPRVKYYTMILRCPSLAQQSSSAIERLSEDARSFDASSFVVRHDCYQVKEMML